MFYYYGRRKQVAHLYPKPKFKAIFEPFAGSAAYSLHWAEQGAETDVFLVDRDETIVSIWKYLLQASSLDISSLPTFNVGDNLNDFSLSVEEKALIGLHINPGSSVPKLTVSKASRWEAGRKYITKMLPLVRHWKVECGDYSLCKNRRATWFIDPPFQQGGCHYRYHNIDFTHLGNWVESRYGQVIVCEAEPATWLPFEYLGVTINNGGLNSAKRRQDLIYKRGD